jgi:hypothetical protein
MHLSFLHKIRHNLDHLPDPERAPVGGRFLKIAIASASRIKRMAAFIVRRLCRQRRSRQRKQLPDSPPLYQDTLMQSCMKCYTAKQFRL